MVSAPTALIENEEQALWSAMHGETRERARQLLFARYSGFARALAWKHFRLRSRGDLELEDLRQLASTGLLEAIDRFDATRGTAFRTYAAHRVSGSIANGIARMSDVRGQLAARARLRRERIESLTPANAASLSGADALDALAELAMGIAVGIMLEGTSLYVDGEDDAPDEPASVGGYESAAWAELIERLSREIDGLPPREQVILKHHYLEGASFDMLADLFGLSKGRISQLHRSALATLRKRLALKGHFSLQR